MPVLPSYRNQLTGFYMRATLAFNGLSTLFLYDQILCVFSLSRIAIAMSKLDFHSTKLFLFIRYCCLTLIGLVILVDRYKHRPLHILKNRYVLR